MASTEEQEEGATVGERTLNSQVSRKIRARPPKLDFQKKKNKKNCQTISRESSGHRKLRKILAGVSSHAKGTPKNQSEKNQRGAPIK